MRGLSFIPVVLASVLCAFALPTDEMEKRQNVGRGTYFEVGLGACGYYNTDDQPVVAISSQIYDGGAHCGETVVITSNGVTEYATVVDECPGCGPDDLDLSPSLFEDFAPLSVGVIQVSWYFD